MTKLCPSLGPNHASQTEKFLKNASPHLFAGIKAGEVRVVRRPVIKEPEGWDELYSEGYDPEQNLPAGACYWRIVWRGEKPFYLSTVAIDMDHLLKAWGTAGLPYYDFTVGAAAIRIETELAELSDAERESMLDKMPREDRELLLSAAKSRRARTMRNPPKNRLWPYHKSQQEEYLRTAKPCLIARMVVLNEADAQAGLAAEISYEITESVPEWDGIEEEGFDENGILGATYWRTIIRADQRLYICTFALDEADILKTWGTEAIKHFDHELGAAPVCVEVEVSEKYPSPIAEFAMQEAVWGTELQEFSGA